MKQDPKYWPCVTVTISQAIWHPCQQLPMLFLILQFLREKVHTVHFCQLKNKKKLHTIIKISIINCTFIFYKYLPVKRSLNASTGIWLNTLVISSWSSNSRDAWLAKSAASKPASTSSPTSTSFVIILLPTVNIIFFFIFKI